MTANFPVSIYVVYEHSPVEKVLVTASADEAQSLARRQHLQWIEFQMSKVDCIGVGSDFRDTPDQQNF